MQVRVFLDVLNRGPALQKAWYGWVIEGIRKGETKTSEGFDCVHNTPNAIAIIGLNDLLGHFRKPAELHIQTNSRHLAGMLSNGYVEQWEKNGWILNTGKEVKNRVLWEEAWKNLRQHTFQIEYVKVNERSDLIKREIERRREKKFDEDYLEFLDQEWNDIEKIMEEMLGGECA